VTAAPEPIERRDCVTATLVGEYRPAWHHPNKRIVFEIACPPGAAHGGRLAYIDFPGGARVDAHFGNFVIPTDQPRSGGGEGSAPTPFVTFLSTIGTCAGIYVLGFCRQRGLPTEGIRLVQQMRMDRAGWAPGGRLRPEGRLGRAGRGHFGLSGRCARRSSAWEPRERRLVDVPTGVQVAAGR